MIKATIQLHTVEDVSEFIKQTSKLECDVDLVKGRYVIDAKSIIGVFTLDLSEPIVLYIHSENKELLEPFNKWRKD